MRSFRVIWNRMWLHILSWNKSRSCQWTLVSKTKEISLVQENKIQNHPDNHVELLVVFCVSWCLLAVRSHKCYISTLCLSMVAKGQGQNVHHGTSSGCTRSWIMHDENACDLFYPAWSPFVPTRNPAFCCCTFIKMVWGGKFDHPIMPHIQIGGCDRVRRLSMVKFSWHLDREKTNWNNVCLWEGTHTCRLMYQDWAQ